MRVYVAWLVKRKEITTGNPMDETEPPIVPQKLIAVLTDNDHERLFEVCSGRDFLSLRDTAIMLLFMDTGLRVSELGSLGVDAVKLGERRFKVVGKGNREREVGFSSNTGLALARYLKVRAKHIRDDSISALWLNRWGRPLSVDGIKDMLNRRGEQAGISGSLHAHRYRHDFLASLEARWWQRRRAHGNWWMDNAKDGRTLWTGRQGGAGIGGARPYLAGRPDLVVRRCGDMIMVYYRYGHVTDAIAA
jgi:site-specific recombinase XerC